MAATGELWQALGRSPGISDDGQIVTFYGDLTSIGASLYKTTAGFGIFASIDEGIGTRKLIRLSGELVELNGNGDGICDPGETCKPPVVEDLDNPTGNMDGICDKWELCKVAGVLEGEDTNHNYLYLESFTSDSRVAVVHYPISAPGIQRDHFVISDRKSVV